MKAVIIIGTGGHAKVVADIVLSSRDHLVGFLTSENKTNFMGWPVLGKDTEYDRFIDYYFVIAIGNPNVREQISTAMQGVKWYTAIHPSASISTIQTSIGEGSVVMANAAINACAQIGKHCIINTGSIIEHDNIIEDFVHVSGGGKIGWDSKTWKEDMDRHWGNCK